MKSWQPTTSTGFALSAMLLWGIQSSVNLRTVMQAATGSSSVTTAQRCRLTSGFNRGEISPTLRQTTCRVLARLTTDSAPACRSRMSMPRSSRRQPLRQFDGACGRIARSFSGFWTGYESGEHGRLGGNTDLLSNGQCSHLWDLR